MLILQECNDKLAASKRERRVRLHNLQYKVDGCPYPTILARTWLVIENASIEDASNEYECFGEYSISNPTSATISAKKVFHVNPGGDVTKNLSS